MTIRKTTVALIAVMIGMAVFTNTAGAATRDMRSTVVSQESERAEVKVDAAKANHDNTSAARK